MKLNNWQPYLLDNYEIETVQVTSLALKNNPLKDPIMRNNPVLSPLRSRSQRMPLVFILSGFGSNAPQYLSPKGFEPSFVQVIDQLSSRINLRCRFVFVDAWTSWGGSQFINSKGMGQYEDYIVGELYEKVKTLYKVSQTAVFGGSSGGYGALHLASCFPDQFNYAVAIAPDSYFEQSLVSEVLKVAPFIEELGGVSGVKKLLRDEAFLNRPMTHSIINVIAMGLCYSSSGAKKVNFPVDLPSGKINEAVLKQWLKHDPICFLKQRAQKLKNTKGIYLSAGTKDQFSLQYGTEQIYKILRQLQVKCEHHRFDGNHFDLASQRPRALKWLSKQFASH